MMERPVTKIPRSNLEGVPTWSPSATRDVISLPGIPSAFIKSKHFIPAVDQGNIGLCGSNAFGKLVDGTLRQMGYSRNPTSRLFTNYWSMVAESKIRKNHELVLGSATRTMFDSGKNEGLCTEDIWSYRPSTYKNKPNQKAIASGLKCKIKNYSVLTSVYLNNGGYDLYLIKRCIAQGYCCMINILYWDHLNLSEYNIKAPDSNNPVNPSMDNHAMVLVGYDDYKTGGPERNGRVGAFYFQNSWGPRWGDGTGHAWLPYELCTPDKVFDAFTIDEFHIAD